MLTSRAVNDLDYQSLINWNDPLTHGLVYWHLNLPGRFGGTRAYDLVNGKLSTRTGMTSPPTATSGQGTTIRPGGWGEERFDGSGDYITSPNPPVTVVPMTLCGWVKPRIPQDGVIVGLFQGGVTLTITLGMRDTGRMYVQQHTSSGSGYAESVSTHTAGTWAWACGVFSTNASRTLYVNGRFESDNTTSVIDIAYNTLNIGRDDFATPGSYLNAASDDIMIYNRVLSPSEVAVLYEDTRTFHPRMLRRIDMPIGMAMTAAGIASRRLLRGVGI